MKSCSRNSSYVYLSRHRWHWYVGAGAVVSSQRPPGERLRPHPTPLTEALAAEGIAVHYADAVENIPAEVRENAPQTLVVLTPAIPAGHQEWAWLRENGYDIRKRSQVLGVLTQGQRTIAVAGTHGKTTTSSWWRTCSTTRASIARPFWGAFP